MSGICRRRNSAGWPAQEIFNDFTRYRPRVMNVGVERRVSIPNTTVLFAKGEQAPDFLFFHLLEPHAFGEDYVDSVLELLKYFGAERYTQVGGISDSVPHTRPLQVTGITSDEVANRFRIERSNYQGPTSITYLITQGTPGLGIETANFLAHLPHYAQLDEDYSGVARLLEILCQWYGLAISFDRQRAGPAPVWADRSGGGPQSQGKDHGPAAGSQLRCQGPKARTAEPAATIA